MNSGARASLRDRIFRRLLVAMVCVSVMPVVQSVIWPTREQALRHASAMALSGRQPDVALSAAMELLKLQPESADALLLAGSAAAATRNIDLSDFLFSRILASDSAAFRAELGIAGNLLRRGQAVAAEQRYRDILQRDPGNTEACRRLGFLLQTEGRVWESVPCLSHLISAGQFTGDELIGIVAPERYFASDSQLEATLQSEPAGDPVIRLGDIRRRLVESREAGIRAELETIVRDYPHLAEAQARLGRLIVDEADDAEFRRWHAQVTAEHEHHPEIWYVRGLWARRSGMLDGAVRCFLETLVRFPSHPGANYQISGCFLQLRQPERSRDFSDLVPLLAQLDHDVHNVRLNPSPENARQVISLLQKLGRHWEAAAWAELAGRFPEPASWSQSVSFAELRKAEFPASLTNRDAQPALRIDRNEFPLPDWNRLAEPTPAASAPSTATSAAAPFDEWHFSDEAAKVGIDFLWDDGTIPATRMRHVVETLGGGVGVLDSDGDGWPDLYFPQADTWRQPGARSLSDRIFRNSGLERFTDVTVVSGLGDTAFSHGAAVGDYDCDGWPDLCVTNFGPNTCWHNNGDGTFSESTAHTGIAGHEWSASSAFADLSEDGFPDLFVVNYLDRDYVISHPCFVSGVEVGCTPDRLPPATNRLYLNSGDGRFTDISDQSGVLAESGNGLGLVVADFQNDQRLSIFVGNDSTPNFLFRNQAPDGDHAIRLEQQGIAAGVAFNAGGSTIASMGIAAGDANADGRLDLFVTTYLNDPDTLFVQQSDGSFLDETRRSQLHRSTASVLGFGSQFLDTDNDGSEDLVATNGHVAPPPPHEPDDRRDLMPTQVFANSGNGTFAEVPPDVLGPFFRTRALGRGLAVCDWNRDGRQDFAVSYIHHPAALVTNQTSTRNNRLVVRLVGTAMSRDAFGTVAHVQAGSLRLMRQLTAGSGYLSSNQRHLWFGLGAEDVVQELTVRWPRGIEQHFRNIAANQEILIIQDRQEPLVLHRWASPE